MIPDIQITILMQIYRTFDHFMGGFSVACKRFCSRCCTCNVTATTLEGYLIVDHLIRTKRLDLLDGIQAESSKRRFQPKMTTNMLADLCARGEDIPEEESDAKWGNCPVLDSGECPIYSVRPFGCRCMVSKQDCAETGIADMDPFVMSVSSLFLQTIEHVDQSGYSGNLMDILQLMTSETYRDKYRQGTLTVSEGTLIPNRPMRVLFVPPEHRHRIKPILSSLRKIRAPVPL